MNRLFFRILFAAVGATLVMTLILAGVFSIGYRSSLHSWEKSKSAEAETIAEKLLTGSLTVDGVRVSDDSPLFIYDVDKQVVFSNRGSGRGRVDDGQNDLSPIIVDQKIIGYYHLGSVQFRENEANDVFLSSMGNFIAIGLAAAIVLSVVVSVFLSRSLAAPAVAVVAGLNRIGEGDLAARVLEKGADEISSIAASVNTLAVRLSNEQESRRQWIQDITHDLRTPVSAMKAQFEGMADGVLPMDTDRIQRNLEEIGRIEALVIDLEELMKLESPELVLGKETVQIGDIFSDLQSRFGTQLVSKDVQLGIQIEADSVHADKKLIYRAISNLLSNAIRHVGRVGRITLRADTKEGWVRLSVENTGNHLNDDELEKAFRRLYRGEYARTTPGSGLGLTIVRSIATLHGGETLLENIEPSGENSGGVRATVLLPEGDSDSYV